MSERYREDLEEVVERGTVTAENHFTICPDWLLEHPDVSDRALRVWLILMSYARAKDVKVAWLGRRKLAERCKCSVDTIDRAIRVLEDVGAVRVTARHREEDNGQTSNDYTLFTWPHGCGSPAGTTSATSTPAAPVRRPPSRERGGPRRVSAAPREKALDREHLSSLSRSSHATTADTSDAAPRPLNDVCSSTQVGDARGLRADWAPNHTHAVVALELGVDLTEALDEFRDTQAAQAERRSNWDATFTAYLRDFADGREKTW